MTTMNCDDEMVGQPETNKLIWKRHRITTNNFIRHINALGKSAGFSAVEFAKLGESLHKLKRIKESDSGRFL